MTQKQSFQKMMVRQLQGYLFRPLPNLLFTGIPEKRDPGLRTLR